MLTLRPQPPPVRPVDNIVYQRRGRSRQVSYTALARQASEERRAEDMGSYHRLCIRAIPAEHTLAERGPEEKSELVPILSPRPLPDAPLIPVQTMAGGAQKESMIIAPVPVKVPQPSFLPSLSSYPPASASLSIDYYDSPPSPPRSLEDQVHVAYALDDMHLAKVLLLKLKGIEVTCDDDPRIAAVTDEDFDFCFVPHGKLMDEEDEKALLEQQKNEMKKIEERRRTERLRMCERIWEQEKQRLRDERTLALRRKEMDEKRRAEEKKRVDEEKRVAKEKQEAAEAERRARSKPTRSSVKPPRNVVSYDSLGKSRAGLSHPDEPFVYEFMTPRSRPISQSSSSQSLSQASTSSQSLSQISFQTFSYDESRAVPFADVLASMQGPLFPPEPKSTRSPSKRRDSHLLDSLLQVLEWEGAESRRRKGKAVEKPRLQRKNSDKSSLASPCAACSSPVSSSSSLSSPASSRRSWLSFSSSTSSTSTAATTPSTSPPSISSWFAKPDTISARKASVSSTLAPTPSQSSLCCKSHTHLTLVPPSESPLPIPYTRNGRGTSSTQAPFHIALPGYNAQDSSSRTRSKTPPSGRVMRRVSRFVEIAMGLQAAYMNAALFSVPSSDLFDGRNGQHTNPYEGWQVRNDTAKPSWRRPKPTGNRVCPRDLAIFLEAPSPPAELVPPSKLSPAIPLRPRRASNEPQRTILPDPLPYPIVFKPLPIPCRSPFRLNTHVYHVPHSNAHQNSTPAPWATHSTGGGNPGGYGGTITWRVRTVENPVYLRLKALHKIMWDRGTNWQGRARDGSLGAGKEKVLMVAFEGIGRSWLGAGHWED